MRALAPVLVVLASGCGANGDELDPVSALDSYARSVAAALEPRWTGPRVEPPRPEPRPLAVGAFEGTTAPVAVHFGATVSPERARRALRVLEGVVTQLERGGWPAPPPDGPLGGSPSFDLYITTPSSGESNLTWADAHADGPVAWSLLDAVSAWARVDGSVPDALLESCVTDAYAQAMLLALEPAEARVWRRATAAWITGRLTGRWGCEDAVVEQQRQSWRGWVSGALGDGSGAGALLESFARRADGGSGWIWSEAWQVARQRTWEGDGLRASPDLWAVLRAMFPRPPAELTSLLRQIALDRYVAYPAGTQPPSYWRTRWERLPAAAPPFEPELERLGTAYARVDVRAAPPGSALRVWLRGERGVRWALGLLRLDDGGRELSRIVAPSLEEPRAYLRAELFDGTAEVVVAVTNFGAGDADADEPDASARSFELIVDRGDGGEEAAPPTR
ncbi:MAG: hypothetical protein NZ898_12420 [Myxococcota bacterium]|nr:hypothetical protein [Myxococcota bacterium]MDW8361376.1 hypothetical protein [Myxococcales bacterium]